MKTTAVLHHSLAVLAGLLSIVSVRAQSDDFADGNDTGWTHYAPLDAFGAAATYTVSDGTYRITSPPSPDAGAIGPARAGAVRADVKYKTFFVSVDLKDWDPAEDTSMGILARIQPSVGLAATSGYAFTYQGKDTDVQISRVDGEVPTDLSGHPSLDLIPRGNYRMVFFGVGAHLEGRIYDMNNPIAPLITVTGNDSTYTEGSSGLVVFADQNTRASAVFDNYLATDGRTDPPALKVENDSLTVSWEPGSGLCHALEIGTDLQEWDYLPFPHAFTAGKLTVAQGGAVSDIPTIYYRLRLGPQPLPIAAE